MLYLSSLAKISFEEKGRRYRYGTLLSLRISVDRERIGRQRGMVVFFNSVNIVERWSTINSTRWTCLVYLGCRSPGVSSQPPERSSSYLCLPIVPSPRRLCCLHTVFPFLPSQLLLRLSLSLSLPCLRVSVPPPWWQRSEFEPRRVEEEPSPRARGGRRTKENGERMLSSSFASPHSPLPSPGSFRLFPSLFQLSAPVFLRFFRSLSPSSLSFFLSLRFLPPSLPVSVSVSLLSFSRGQRTGARRDRNHTHARCEPARLWLASSSLFGL